MAKECMELVKITDVTKQLGLSSRTLRYYEQVGLIESIRPKFEAYRYYDEEAVERLQQIIILRKMQISVKDIVRIYENPEMAAVVSVFVDKIREIDREVTALSELKEIIHTFLQRMITSGVKKITALPLLYEEMEKQFMLREEGQREEGQQETEGRKREAGSVSYGELSEVSRMLARPVECAIVSLPSMRMLTSRLKADPGTSDPEGFWRFIQAAGIPRGEAGRHTRFERMSDSGNMDMVRIADDYENDSAYADIRFEGGLYAAANVYVDEELNECFRQIVESFDGNRTYQTDYLHAGELRRPVLLENLISPDEKRELVSLYVPVKKCVPDPALYGKPVEIPADRITIADIEGQEHILWEKEVPLDALTPVNAPHFRVLDNGEAEYTGWISTRVLNTNVAVKLPFRVDIEFRLAGDDERFEYGSDEGSIRFYRSGDTGYLSGGKAGQNGFGINVGNRASGSVSEKFMRKEAIVFWQPVFFDRYEFPGRGGIKQGEYNRVTWIVGAHYFAVIINGEIRYCAEDFPYMFCDLGEDRPQEIMIGSDGQGMKYFRSIRITQLADMPGSRLQGKRLILPEKRSNNSVRVMHRLITSEYGENYWFNGCAAYVMECLGEPYYDYTFFAGLTGDMLAQTYSYAKLGETENVSNQPGVTVCMLAAGPAAYLREAGEHMELCQGVGESADERPGNFVERIFAACGYASTFVSGRELRRNKEVYTRSLMASIDRGVPVIQAFVGEPFRVIVGYEEYGGSLLCITGDKEQPERFALEEAIGLREGASEDTSGWIFVGDKIGNPELAAIYRERVRTLPKLLTTDTDRFCAGAQAFRAWADFIESGVYDHIRPEEFEAWRYIDYVCILATNATCGDGFLERARQLNPDMGFLETVCKLYWKGEALWHNENGEDLEAIGGGFNITLEALQDPARRGKITAKLRQFAQVFDEIVRVLKEGLAALPDSENAGRGKNESKEA